MINFINRIQNLLKKSPSYIAYRILFEIKSYLNIIKYYFIEYIPFLPMYEPSNFFISLPESKSLKDPQNYISKANEIILGQIHILGENTNFIKKIDWHSDFKVNYTWEKKYYKFYNYNHLELNNDVKIPWELSRHQFLVTVAQAYYISNHSKYLSYIEDTFNDWVSQNPTGFSINWACTMDVALRVFSWFIIWEILKDKINDSFKKKLLKHMYIHYIFISENIEKSDINGNHYLTDIVIAFVLSIFFKKKNKSKEYQKLIEKEIYNETYEEGLNFEGSIPYHRLITELFLIVEVCASNSNIEFSREFYQRYSLLFSVISFYTKPNGLCPIFGDNDNGRAFILEELNFNNHTYLLDFCNVAYGSKFKTSEFSFSKWLKYTKKKFDIFHPIKNDQILEKSGLAKLENDWGKVIIELSSLGLAGRGGHGHNDFSSFELTIGLTDVIVDTGCYCYTSNYKDRNYSRSSSAHNILTIDNHEINDFVDEKNLWHLKNQMEPRHFKSSSREITCSHESFKNIDKSIDYERKFILEENSLIIKDKLKSEKSHNFESIFILPHSAIIKFKEIDRISFKIDEKTYIIHVTSNSQITLAVEKCWISYNFGEKNDSNKLVISGSLNNNLELKYVIKEE